MIMASTASKGRKKTPAKTGRGGAKGGKQKTTRKPSAAELQAQSAITSEIILIGVLALTILLFLCNFGVIGVIGNQISRVMFGIFGTMAYALPVLAFIAIAFGISNQGNRIASMKLTAGIILFFLLGVVCSLLFQGGTLSMDYSIRELYLESAEKRLGGGVISGSLAWGLHRLLGMVGTVLLLLVLVIICTVIITERSFVNGVKTSGRYVYETARSDAQRYRERSERRRKESEERYEQRRQANEERSKRLRQENEERSEKRREEELAREKERKQLARQKQLNAEQQRSQTTPQGRGSGTSGCRSDLPDGEKKHGHYGGHDAAQGICRPSRGHARNHHNRKSRSGDGAVYRQTGKCQPRCRPQE